MTRETTEITRDDYAAQLNTDFTISFAPEHKVTMKLTEVSEEIERYHQRSYSLIFQAPAETPLAQGMVVVEHEVLGSFELFIVPIGKDQNGVMFQALFNRLVESA